MVAEVLQQPDHLAQVAVGDLVLSLHPIGEALRVGDFEFVVVSIDDHLAPVGEVEVGNDVDVHGVRVDERDAAAFARTGHRLVVGVAAEGGVDGLDVVLRALAPLGVLAHVEHEVGVELLLADRVDDRLVSPGSLGRLAQDQRTVLIVGLERGVYGVNALGEQLELCVCEVDGVLEQDVEVIGELHVYSEDSARCGCLAIRKLLDQRGELRSLVLGKGVGVDGAQFAAHGGRDSGHFLAIDRVEGIESAWDLGIEAPVVSLAD